MVETRLVFRNPAFRLKVKAESAKAKGGGSKSLKPPQQHRLPKHQKILSRQLQELFDEFAELPTYDGKILIWGSMHDTALSVTTYPADLFMHTDGISMRAPWRDGYIVEVSKEGLVALLRRVKAPSSEGKKVDIANVRAIEYFPSALLKDKDPIEFWDSAVKHDGRPIFRILTPAYSTPEATTDVLSALDQFFVGSGDTILLSSAGPDLLPPVTTHVPAESSISITTAKDPLDGHPSKYFGKVPKKNAQFSFLAAFDDIEKLRQLILSGSAVRWEAATKLSPRIPGFGEEPPINRVVSEREPIVGAVDGGYHANRYKSSIAWEAPKVVPDSDADRSHGNKICSILVDGDLWSNNVNLPALPCRLGILQAVPSKQSHFQLTSETVASALDAAMLEHPETKVWNISANYDHSSSPHDVSQAAHLLGQVARKHSRLLVISAGNRAPEDPNTIAPPADCEAALVVAGRLPDLIGDPGEPCPDSRTAFGPDFMTKPDLSWYSDHRVLGGGIARATSFATPLVSRLAAHCFQNIADPTPDLVRALLINSADLTSYCDRMGFGTPNTGMHPWLCRDSSVILAWNETISAQTNNSWAGIAIPPSMIKNGRLVGKVKLVTVLRPKIQRRGDQYIATRFAPNIKVREKDGWSQNNILSAVLPETLERVARKKHAKWQPTRCFQANFNEQNGPWLDLTRPILRVGGRVYWRHKYMFDDATIQNEQHEVAFVLSLESPDTQANTYNEFKQLMGNAVEDIVINLEQEVEEQS